MVQLGLGVSGVGKRVGDLSVLTEVWHGVTQRVLLWLLKALCVELLADGTLGLSEGLVGGEDFLVFTKVRHKIVSLDIGWLLNSDHVTVLGLSLVNVKLGHFDVSIDAKVRDEIVSLRRIRLFPGGCQSLMKVLLTGSDTGLGLKDVVVNAEVWNSVVDWPGRNQPVISSGFLATLRPWGSSSNWSVRHLGGFGIL